MSKALRLQEKWFRFGLWLVAFILAGFLIGLGSTVVKDLPRVERRYTEEDFIDKPAADRLRVEIKALREAQQRVQDALEMARLKLNAAQADSSTARDSFNNWLATRQATQRSEQDGELIERTQALDKLRQIERKAQAEIEGQQQALLDARQAEELALHDLRALGDHASEKLMSEWRSQELRVFGYRLALTLPLLVIAGWLFAKKRQSMWWPFVWGFIFFALFAFFVELVPYLPSYGGYVRYVVGILTTMLVGRYAIVALNRYLEKQKQAEAKPDLERRKELSYDTALARLIKKVCPGCERSVEMDNPAIDFCPHCGICLFHRCGGCKARKNAFARFCHACGLATGESGE